MSGVLARDIELCLIAEMGKVNAVADGKENGAE